MSISIVPCGTALTRILSTNSFAMARSIRRCRPAGRVIHLPARGELRRGAGKVHDAAAPLVHHLLSDRPAVVVGAEEIVSTTLRHWSAVMAPRSPSRTIPAEFTSTSTRLDFSMISSITCGLGRRRGHPPARPGPSALGRPTRRPARRPPRDCSERQIRLRPPRRTIFPPPRANPAAPAGYQGYLSCQSHR